MSDLTNKIALDRQLEKLEQISRDNPEDPSTLMTLGEMSFRRGQKLAALLAFQKVAAMSPEVVEAHLALAKIYLSQKMYAEAYGELIQTLKFDKNCVEARVLYDILAHEASVPLELLSLFKSYFSLPHNPEAVASYLQQLSIEKEWLNSDVQELSVLLESSPGDTILEYNKNMAVRRLQTVEELLERAKSLGSIKFDESGQIGVSEPLVEVAPAVAAPVEVKPVEPSSARMEELFEELREIFDPLMQNLMKNSSIISVAVFLVKAGWTNVVQGDSTRISEVVQALLPSLGILEAYSQGLAYWVIEFQQGVLIFQEVAPGLFLCALGDSFTAFGVLRFHMDKNVSFLQKSIEQLDLSKLNG